MKIIEKVIDIQNNNLVPENSMFLDIETTGFSRVNGRIYLIGTLAKEKNKYIFRQYMTQNQSEEKELLIIFKDLIKKYNTLITFNGEAFDFSFIKSRCERYNIDIDFSQFESVDIYKIVKKQSYFMDFKSHKLKTLEKYIGIDREDIFSGGELISLYYEYENGNKNVNLEKTLLLHNEEDILNLPKLFQLLEIIKEENTIFVESNYFIIDEIKLSKKKLEITGETNINRGYLEDDLKILSIDEGKFLFKSVVEEGMYDKNIKCIYTEKGDYILVCNYNISSPNEIFLLKYHNKILYFNIKILFKSFLEKILI